MVGRGWLDTSRPATANAGSRLVPRSAWPMLLALVGWRQVDSACSLTATSAPHDFRTVRGSTRALRPPPHPDPQHPPTLH